MPRTRSVSKRATAGIPAYSSSGRRLRNYSHEAVERILGLTPTACVAKRNKRTGHICSVQFLPLPQNSSAVEGKEPLRKTAHMGQHYCFEQAILDSGRKAWGFAKILVPREDRDLDDPEDMERRLQLIFRAVPLSCMKRESEPVTGTAALDEPETTELTPEPPTTPAIAIRTRPRRAEPGSLTGAHHTLPRAA